MMLEETCGEGKARCSQDNAVVVVGVLSAAVAVVVVMTLACCPICRLLRRRRIHDEEAPDRPLLNSAEESSSSPASRQSSLLKSAAVPDVVTLCIHEIESRGLVEEGLYRKEGRKRDTDRLREQFKAYSPPDLSTVQDVHVICSCLKGFLLNLSECLLTRALRSDFIDAAGIADRELSMTEIRRTVDRMPFRNRDILVRLIVHLQRVSLSVGCRMGENQLAIIFGPAVVGWSDELDPVKDPKDQGLVMKKLLSIPVEVWRSIEAGTELTVSA